MQYIKDPIGQRAESVQVTATFGNLLAGVAPEQALPGSNALASINWGTQLTSTDVKVYFGPTGYQADGITSEGFNSYEIAQFRAAFAYLATITGLTFSVVNTPTIADFKLILDTNGEIGGYLGYFNPPGTTNAGVGVFNGAAWDRSPGGDLEVGGYGYVTIVHETLHGLGMAHPHDNGGSSSIMTGVSGAFGDSGTYGLNQGLYTTMSYNSGYLDGPVGTAGTYGSWGYEAGPMALDIAVLQAKYGANTTHANGNDLYVMPTANVTGTYWQAIWDTGGTDEIRYSGTDKATIDLRAATLLDEVGGGGWVSAANGVAGGYTIANGVVIENATGGRGNDHITGNNADNLLKGRDGHDQIWGGAGNDRLFGQNGNDQLWGGDGNDRLVGGAGIDTLRGENGKDKLFGQAGDDRLVGGAGNDRLVGGAGNDHMWGGANNDDMFGGTGNDQMWGQSSRDRMFGGAGDDIMDGGGGNDRLVGGAGSDTLIGGNGKDQFVFVAGADTDTVTDFQGGTDRLIIDSSYWGSLTAAADLVSAYANVTAQGVVFDFGGGDVLILEGLTSTAGLDADIYIG